MKPLVLGHRGAPFAATENTMDAFRAALDEGADGVELDVQYTRDGVLVVFHDTMFAGRPVHQWTFHDLCRAMGHRMATLPEVVQGLPADAFLYCEFKRQGSVVEAPAAEAIPALLATRRADRTLLASFDPWFLRCAAGSGVEIGLILEAKMLGEGFDPGAHRFLGTVSMATDLVDTVLPACFGLRTLAWPIDDEADLRRCLALFPALGGVVTKHPGLAVRLRDAH